jgi:hypothetical protein
MLQRALILLAVISFASGAAAQIKIPGVGEVRLPGLDDIFKKGPAITTSIADAKWEAEDADPIAPGDFVGLGTLERSPTGGFVLQEGAFEGRMQSYCLHAGTHGPTAGDGYLYAPVLGPLDKIVSKIAQNSYAHPEIPQTQIQTLLWGIIARAKVSSMSRDMQRIAAQLLTPKEIADLNGGALGLLTDDKIGGAFIKQPPLLRQVYEAEARLRNMLSNPASSFADLERVAVLTGEVGIGPGSRTVPAGRWSLHPDGYYVRYGPSGYSQTHIQLWVPEGSEAVGKEFDPAVQIAVPGNTSRQRLLQSGRFYRED